MKKHDRNVEIISFREHIGTGSYKGHEFEFGYSLNSGMPVISFYDLNKTTITFELEDLLIPAMKEAGLI